MAAGSCEARTEAGVDSEGGLSGVAGLVTAVSIARLSGCRQTDSKSRGQAGVYLVGMLERVQFYRQKPVGSYYTNS